VPYTCPDARGSPVTVLTTHTEHQAWKMPHLRLPIIANPRIAENKRPGLASCSAGATTYTLTSRYYIISELYGTPGTQYQGSDCAHGSKSMNACASAHLSKGTANTLTCQPTLAHLSYRFRQYFEEIRTDEADPHSTCPCHDPGKPLVPGQLLTCPGPRRVVQIADLWEQVSCNWAYQSPGPSGGTTMAVK
jgi:hypothetical protein